MDYEKYTRTNSAILVRNVTLLVDRFNATLQSCFIILTDCTLFVSIFALLLYFDWKSTLVISFVFMIISLSYYFGTKKKFIDWGAQSAKYEGLKFKYLYEGLSSMKDIKISNKLIFFLENYSKNVSAHGMLSVKKTLVKSLPKQTFEILAVLALVVLSLVFITSNKPFDEFLPLAGVFAISAFKILPAGNRILFAFQNLMFDLTSINILHEEIKNNKPNQEYLDSYKDGDKLKFENEIKISNLCFSYKNNNKKILEDINFNIKKNSTIGIIGKSGSGKSTLMDLIIGLLKPTSGAIYCDNVNINDDIFSWYNNIGYVPQSIYLMDDTILNNIAFGVKENDIDLDRVNECVKLSRLDDIIVNNKLGLNTVVGDKGIRLSGGQIQRIGIARALYNKPKILFFDESTSSLDVKTEEEIMHSVNELLTGITKIIITHRITTLKKCDLIYHIENLKISNFGNYDKMSKIKYN
jgi:ABC-type bacteriocin/lantibiotic exporter with double-glycine peptidase domain